MEREHRADVLIVGGGLGGVAAALAVARLGLRALMTEETDWIGGQLTAQAVSAPDEHPWIESFGATRSYQALRAAIRRYYADHYPLLPDRERAYLNPGRGGVSRLCHEPRVGLAALEAMLAPHRAAGRVTVWIGWRAIATDVEHDRVRAVRVADRGGHTAVLHAPWVIDATECGDLLPLTGTEYVTGAEAVTDTGEPHAAPTAAPQDMQSFTWCFVLDHRPGEDHTVPRPEGYDACLQAGHLSWVQPHPVTGEPRRYAMFPGEGDPSAYPLWTYRRILDRTQFAEGAFPSDLSLINWPQNDYTGGSIIDVPAGERERALMGARRLSLSLLHWLQTEAPRPDGGQGWPGLCLRPDVTGTPDGLAMVPYVRESRRIVPVFRVLEQHVALQSRSDGRAEAFRDTAGIGLYRIDLHPAVHTARYIDLSCCPFQIPLGALLPARMRNLLAGCKNIGTTHITNGAYRLHPVEWNIGEAAGALAAFCEQHALPPHGVRERAASLDAFQAVLRRLGVPLEWPAAHAV